jgi:hypothetical protein
MKKKSKVKDPSNQLQFYYRNRERILARNKLKRLESRMHRIFKDYGNSEEGQTKFYMLFEKLLKTMPPTKGDVDEYI